MTERLGAYYEGGSYSLAVRSRPGEGTPVVMLHGWGDTKRVFDGAFEAPDMRGQGLLSIDLLGFGQSDKPHDFSYNVEDQAGVVAELIKRKFPQGAHIVGHSMGGLIGLIASHELNAKALSFTSVEGNLHKQDTSEAARRIAHMPARTFGCIGYPAVTAALLANPSAVNRAWGRGWLAASPLALQRSALSLERWSDVGGLARLFQQTPRRAYIGGEDSDHFARAQQLLDPHDMHVVPNSGHVPMRTSTADFYRTLASLLHR